MKDAVAALREMATSPEPFREHIQSAARHPLFSQRP